MSRLTLRAYASDDLEEVLKLFYDTVHSVNLKDYTPAQADAWAGPEPDREAWNASLIRNRALVALLDGKIVGFADMDATGYLDRLYVHRDFQRRGIATALCDALEARAGQSTFTTHASITARPFFESRGYRLVRAQSVRRARETLTNYVMQKGGETECAESTGR